MHNMSSKAWEIVFSPRKKRLAKFVERKPTSSAPLSELFIPSSIRDEMKRIKLNSLNKTIGENRNMIFQDNQNSRNPVFVPPAKSVLFSFNEEDLKSKNLEKSLPFQNPSSSKKRKVSEPFLPYNYGELEKSRITSPILKRNRETGKKRKNVTFSSNTIFNDSPTKTKLQRRKSMNEIEKIEVMDSPRSFFKKERRKKRKKRVQSRTQRIVKKKKAFNFQSFARENANRANRKTNFEQNFEKKETGNELAIGNEIHLWLESLPIFHEKLPNKVNDWYNGINFSILLGYLKGKTIPGINYFPKQKASITNNLRRCIEVLKSTKNFESPYILDYLRIAEGNQLITIGLLSDIFNHFCKEKKKLLQKKKKKRHSLTSKRIIRNPRIRFYTKKGKELKKRGRIIELKKNKEEEFLSVLKRWCKRVNFKYPIRRNKKFLEDNLKNGVFLSKLINFLETSNNFARVERISKMPVDKIILQPILVHAAEKNIQKALDFLISRNPKFKIFNVKEVIDGKMSLFKMIMQHYIQRNKKMVSINQKKGKTMKIINKENRVMQRRDKSGNPINQKKKKRSLSYMEYLETMK